MLNEELQTSLKLGAYIAKGETKANIALPKLW